MPRKSKREPTLLPYVLKAIGKLKDDRGSTASRIVHYVHTLLKNSNMKVKSNKLAPHVKKALQHGVEVGLFKMKPGRYLIGSQSQFAMDSKESLKAPPERKNKQPSASATPTTLSSISACPVSSNASSVDDHHDHQAIQNKQRRRSRSRKQKGKRKRRRREEHHSVPSGGSTPKPEPPVKQKPVMYRSTSRISNVPKKELSSKHHKDHVKYLVSALKSRVCLPPQRNVSGRISKSVRHNEND